MQRHTRGQFWRRILVVDRSFQLKYSLLFAGTGAGVTAIATLLWMVPTQLRPELALPSWAVVLELLGVSALTGTSLWFFGLWLTHRVAGPLYAMTHDVSELSRGRYPPVRPLRRTDELREFFDLFQKSVDCLRAREIEEAFRLQDVIVQLDTCGLSREAPEAMAALRALHERKCLTTGRPDAGRLAALAPPKDLGDPGSRPFRN